MLALWLPGRYTKCWSSGYLGDTPSVGALVTWEIHQVLAVLIIIGYDGMAKYYERTTVTVSGLINV